MQSFIDPDAAAKAKTSAQPVQRINGVASATDNAQGVIPSRERARGSQRLPWRGDPRQGGHRFV